MPALTGQSFRGFPPDRPQTHLRRSHRRIHQPGLTCAVPAEVQTQSSDIAALSDEVVRERLAYLRNTIASLKKNMTLLQQVGKVSCGSSLWACSSFPTTHISHLPLGQTAGVEPGEVAYMPAAVSISPQQPPEAVQQAMLTPPHQALQAAADTLPDAKKVTALSQRLSEGVAAAAAAAAQLRARMDSLDIEVSPQVGPSLSQEDGMWDVCDVPPGLGLGLAGLWLQAAASPSGTGQQTGLVLETKSLTGASTAGVGVGGVTAGPQAPASATATPPTPMSSAEGSSRSGSSNSKSNAVPSNAADTKLQEGPQSNLAGPVSSKTPSKAGKQVREPYPDNTAWRAEASWGHASLVC